MAGASTDQLQSAEAPRRVAPRTAQRTRATTTTASAPEAAAETATVTRARPTRARKTGQTAQTAAQGMLFPTEAATMPHRVMEASSSFGGVSALLPSPQTPRGLGMGTATAMPGLTSSSYAYPLPATAVLTDPDVWLIATATATGGMRALDGMNRSGAIRVGRPYGHLRAVRPVLPPSELEASTPRGRRAKGASPSSNLPAPRPTPAIISAVEIETDTGIFRVERPNSVLGHSDLAWALANLESGEPDALVPMPRRQLALLLTLLPTPEDPEHPEQDPTWGWAHRLKGPWERGPLHPRGRLGRLISIDPDPTGHGMHRASFEVLGGEEIVWALGVPCFRSGSVYELVPASKSRFLSWPLTKSRAKGTIERPAWEISRVVYRVGNPRWPLAGVVEPLGPMGTAG